MHNIVYIYSYTHIHRIYHKSTEVICAYVILMKTKEKSLYKHRSKNVTLNFWVVFMKKLHNFCTSRKKMLYDATEANYRMKMKQKGKFCFFMFNDNLLLWNCDFFSKIILINLLTILSSYIAQSWVQFPLVLKIMIVN